MCQSELLVTLPGTVWRRVLDLIGEPSHLACVAIALLAGNVMRSSALADDELWHALACASSGIYPCSASGPRWRRYVRQSLDLQLARALWAVTAPYDEHEPLGYLAHAEVSGEVSSVRATGSVIAAACRSSNVLSFFKSDLVRLPSLRLQGRSGIDAFDLAPDQDVLAAGGVDGRITLHSLSDANARGWPLGSCEGPKNLSPHVFSGLHFAKHAGGAHLVAAAHGSTTAQVFDTETAKLLTTSPRVGDAEGVCACEPLDSATAALLVYESGLVCLWDTRSSSLTVAAQASRSLSSSVVVGVDSASQAAVMVRSPRTTISWLDWRAGRTSECELSKVWPTVFAVDAPARVVMAHQGFVAAWFDAPERPLTCSLSSGPALVPVMATEAAGAATAVGRDGPSSPLIIGVARPSKRRMVFEVCTPLPRSSVNRLRAESTNSSITRADSSASSLSCSQQSNPPQRLERPRTRQGGLRSIVGRMSGRHGHRR
mmetsp:Transcript_9179/g.25649  ORF Transcript_9179/g.25649 Transcript_9179/m.25649 type:complete len:486 (-) Transcript_9179:60-1517(-)